MVLLEFNRDSVNVNLGFSATFPHYPCKRYSSQKRSFRILWRI